mmetsp:Transcript_77902/g.147124  ORF Transcript_77902/g.147124 Transcript_77902/m.147124 type:complete len:371 (+) Transcript_77902:95-1207(+)
MPKPELISPEDGDLCSTSEMSTCVTASSPDLEKSRLNQGDILRENSEDQPQKPTRNPNPAKICREDSTVRNVCRNLSQLLEANVIGKALDPSIDISELGFVGDGSEVKSRSLEPPAQSEECPPTPERVVAAEELAAERSKVERLTAERAAAERLASERQVAERRAAERLTQAEAREAAFEKQIAAEKVRVAELSAELEKSRREVQAKREEADNAGALVKELRAREQQILAHAQSLESCHKDAKNQVETLKFQHHLVEVDLNRNKVQLDAAVERQKILEEELRLLKEPLPMSLPMAALQVGRNKPPALLARHGMASRAAFDQTHNQHHRGPAEVREQTGSPKKPAPPPPASRSFFACCSPSTAEKSGTISR